MVKGVKFKCSIVKKDSKNEGRWSEEEQERFLKACYYFKDDWIKIKEYIKTRTIPQIRSHAQKYLIKLCKKYSIKLYQKKFSNKPSKHLNSTRNPCKNKLNIDKMNIYEKNILNVFSYYNREISNNEDDKNNAVKNNINNFNNLITKENSHNFKENINEAVKENIFEKNINFGHTLKENIINQQSLCSIIPSLNIFPPNSNFPFLNIFNQEEFKLLNLNNSFNYINYELNDKKGNLNNNYYILLQKLYNNNLVLNYLLNKTINQVYPLINGFQK